MSLLLELEWIFISQRAKKGFRDFALNSKNGVKTPSSWYLLMTP